MTLSQRLATALLLAAAQSALAAVTILPGTVPAEVEQGVEFGPVMARVTDLSGAPVPGAVVTWRRQLSYTRLQSEDVSGCTFDTCIRAADANGTVQLPRLFSLFQGPASLELRATHPQAEFIDLGLTSFSVNVVPYRRMPSVTPVRVDYSAVQLGEVSPRIAVQVLDFEGRPLEGVDIAFQPFPAGPKQAIGYFPDRAFEVNVRIDANGIAQAPPVQASLGLGVGHVVAMLPVPNTHNYLTVNVPYTVTDARGRTALPIQDLWWSGFEENGWGMSITQHGDRFFMVAFVYGPDGRPTWHVMPDGKWRDGLRFSHFEGPMYQPRGTPYFNYRAFELQVGTPSLFGNGRFIDEARAEIEFRAFPTLRATKNIKRQDFSSATPSPITGLGDMWWGGPTQNGWGIAIHEQPGGLFSVWFTYDAQGLPTWLVMPEGSWTTSSTYEGTIYRTQSSSWPDYDPSRLQVIAAGRFRYTFPGTDRATFEYSVDGNSGRLELERQGF